MNINLNIFLSFGAGLLAFLSPCVLPVIPSYLTFISGVTVKDLRQSRYKRRDVFLRTLAFVAGFLLLFSLVGVLVFGTFYSLGGSLQFLDIAAGIIVIVLGMNFIFNFLKILNLEKRLELQHRPTSLVGAFVVGMAFGAGWTPCIGPLLQGIFLLTAATETSFVGVINLVFFSLGLGLPFLAMSLFFPALIGRLNRLKASMRFIRVGSGVFLVGIGLLILSGRIQTLTFSVTQAAISLQAWNSFSPLSVRIWGGLLFLVLAFAVLIPFIIRSVKHMRESAMRISPVTAVISIILLLLALLHLGGVINLATILAAWAGISTPQSFSSNF